MAEVESRVLRSRLVAMPRSFRLPYGEIADETFKLREQQEKCTVDTTARDAQIARVNEL